MSAIRKRHKGERTKIDVQFTNSIIQCTWKYCIGWKLRRDFSFERVDCDVCCVSHSPSAPAMIQYQIRGKRKTYQCFVTGDWTVPTMRDVSRSREASSLTMKLRQFDQLREMKLSHAEQILTKGILVLLPSAPPPSTKEFNMVSVLNE